MFFVACMILCYLCLFLLSLYVIYSTRISVFHSPTGLCLGMDNFIHLLSEQFGFGVVELSLTRVAEGRYKLVSEREIFKWHDPT
jgi:hypothetical protein